MTRETVAFFCKSFKDDLSISLRMAESVMTWSSGIPLVISVPRRDYAKFREAHDTRVEIIEDEALVGYTYPDGWLFQQGVKLNVHRLGAADNYVMLDSDFLFFRAVDSSDFIDPSGRACFVGTTHSYSLSRTNKWLLSRLLGDISACEFDGAAASVDWGGRRLTVEQLEAVENRFDGTIKTSDAIQATFGVPGRRIRGFMPGPILNSRVLAELQLLATELPEGVLTLVKKSPWEYTWYGEFALATGDALRRERVEPGVFCALKAADLDSLRESGVTLESMSKNFYGVSLAARHMVDAGFVSPKDFQSKFDDIMEEEDVP